MAHSIEREMVDQVRVNATKSLRIFKAWNRKDNEWQFMVKKYTRWLLLFWVAGWGEGGVYTDVKYFSTIEAARSYAEEVKKNFLGK